MRRILWAVPVAFFFLNPGFACSPAEPQFQYGATEMRAAVEANWSLAIAPQDGGPLQHIIVHVAQAPDAAAVDGQARARGLSLLRPAYACGSRTLVKSAGACLDVTTMPLILTVVSGDPSFPSGKLSGSFTVDGLSFDFGLLELDVGPYQILGQIYPDGTFSDVHVGPLGAPGSLTIVTRS
jgi:hypothetical protein